MSISIATEIVRTLLPAVNTLFTSAWSYNKQNIDHNSFTDEMFPQKLTLIESQIKDTLYNIKDRPNDGKRSIVIQIDEMEKTIAEIHKEIQNITNIMIDHSNKYFSQFRQYDIQTNVYNLSRLKNRLDLQFDWFSKILVMDMYSKK